VSAPHLAIPLLAGVARVHGWDPVSWDLTEQFYQHYGTRPHSSTLKEAAAHGNFQELDDLYFLWEDQFQNVFCDNDENYTFGLLSGFNSEVHSALSLAEVANRVRLQGTPFDAFYESVVLPKLAGLRPSIVAVTIASHHQMIAALVLLQKIRRHLPEAIIVLGGNIVTRLRESPAFQTLRAHADYIAVYQGDLAFGRILDAASADKCVKPKLAIIVGDERIPYQKWSVPYFKGIEPQNYIGTAALPYVSTRGCYWGRCNFCAIPAGWASSGYAGTAPAEYVRDQLIEMVEQTGISKIKMVDEAISPAKVRRLAGLLGREGRVIEWEAYARLEKAWEDGAFLQEAHGGGLRKLYLGLEQAPTTNRNILNKNDKGNIERIMSACKIVGIKLHLFCMVGHPGSSVQDAWETTNFLIAHQDLIDTADLVGFRLDRGTSVRGVRSAVNSAENDWYLSSNYEVIEDGVLSFERVRTLENECQESIWQSAPRLLHPLYRLVGPWEFKDSPTLSPTCDIRPLGEVRA
jgi:hypothetical protein